MTPEQKAEHVARIKIGKVAALLDRVLICWRDGSLSADVTRSTISDLTQILSVEDFRRACAKIPHHLETARILAFEVSKKNNHEK